MNGCEILNLLSRIPNIKEAYQNFNIDLAEPGKDRTVIIVSPRASKDYLLATLALHVIGRIKAIEMADEFVKLNQPIELPELLPKRIEPVENLHDWAIIDNRPSGM